jgi:cytochrome b subunit of formate dehydrogenase
MFATALLSGLAMSDEAGSGAVMKLHIGSVALIGVGVIASLVFGNSRAVLRSARDHLVFNRLDITWLLAPVRHPVRIGGEPRWGKFNAGQELLAWALMGSMGALIATEFNRGPREATQGVLTRQPLWSRSFCSVPTSSWQC